MTGRHTPVTINVTDRTEPFWTHFRQVAEESGLPFTRAVKQAVELWLLREGEPYCAPGAHRDPFRDMAARDALRAATRPDKKLDQ